MTDRASSLLRTLIGRNRRSAPVKALHNFASMVEAGYFNEGASFEVNGEKRMIERLRAADFRVAFDVGANRGDWLVEALINWPRCHIYAFEVAPPTFRRLRERISASSHGTRTTLNCFGLSDQNGSHEMFFFPDHPELTCDLPRHEDYQAIPFDARLCTGDSYAHERRIEKLDFVKVDVEGAEHRVLNGLCGYLSTRRVNCLQFEYGAFSTQTRVLLADYYALLSSNYWIGKIYPTYVEFADYNWRMEDFKFANYCCVSRTRPDLKELLN
jgi:FkbM family methyltransferase